MENPLLDEEFDVTRSDSALDAYGDEGAGYDGARQRRHLERKYTITRKPVTEVEHPQNRDEFVAAVQLYYPEMDEQEALNHLLEHTLYPLVGLDCIRQGLHWSWFESADKGPYLGAAARHFPNRGEDELVQLLSSSGFTPGAGDLEDRLAALAEHMMQDEARIRANRERSAAVLAERNMQWEADAPARDARRKERRVQLARDAKDRAQKELERVTALLADLTSETAE